MPFTYDYPRPMLTVDCVVVKNNIEGKFILLVLRGNEPFKGKWALPGGFVDIDEDLEDAVRRELFEETNVKVDSIKQLFTVGTLNRDPRGRTISVIYYAEVDESVKAFAGDDAKELCWFNINDIPQNLAFDHNAILNKVFKNLLINS